MNGSAGCKMGEAVAGSLGPGEDGAQGLRPARQPFLRTPRRPLWPDRPPAAGESLAPWPCGRGQEPSLRRQLTRPRVACVHLRGDQRALPLPSSPAGGNLPGSQAAHQAGSGGVPACLCQRRSPRHWGKMVKGRRRQQHLSAADAEGGRGERGRRSEGPLLAVNSTLFVQHHVRTPVRPQLLLSRFPHLSNPSSVFWTEREASAGQGRGSPHEPVPPGFS